jgi:hypothetical protein
MSTKMGFWRWALASAAVLIVTGTAGASVVEPTGVTTDGPAALVLYPKLKVDLNTCEGGKCSLTPDTECSSSSDCPSGATEDTIVQLTNTSEFLTKVHCFYTNANSHCSNSPTTVCTDANFRDVCPLGGLCIAGWQETDFRLTLTKRQPISWSINDGLPSLPLATMPGQGSPPQFNEGNIPAVPEVPFTGELLCIEVDPSTELPSDRNDFKGEASEITTIREHIDANKYNAIGIKAIEGAQDGNPNVLNIGGPNAEYGTFDQVNGAFVGCPNILTVDHFFDGAQVVTHDFTVFGPVNSALTIVPCQRDYLTQTANGVNATIQFLVFNEFEQRFSTSTKLNCYKEIRLSDIDTLPGTPGDTFSIFSVGVEGTLTGMSRLRSVPGPNVDGYDGRTILAVLTENWASGICDGAGATTGSGYYEQTDLCTTPDDCPDSSVCHPAGSSIPCDGGPACVSTDTANVQFNGSRDQGDQITIPLP